MLPSKQQNSTTKQLYSLPIRNKTTPESHASLQVKKTQTLTKGKAIDTMSYQAAVHTLLTDVLW